MRTHSLRTLSSKKAWSFPPTWRPCIPTWKLPVNPKACVRACVCEVHACKWVFMHVLVTIKQSRPRIGTQSILISLSSQTLFPEPPILQRPLLLRWQKLVQCLITNKTTFLHISTSCAPPNRLLHNPLYMCHCQTKWWGRGAENHWVRERGPAEGPPRPQTLLCECKLKNREDHVNTKGTHLTVYEFLCSSQLSQTHRKRFHNQLWAV